MRPEIPRVKVEEFTLRLQGLIALRLLGPKTIIHIRGCWAILGRRVRVKLEVRKF